MIDQPTFADVEYESKKRKTRREIFLERMDGLIPWTRLEERIRPFYHKGGRGRPAYPLSVMLRIHCVQLFYNASDPGMEDLLYEAESVRRFRGPEAAGIAARRDYDPELPPSVGGARVGQGSVRGDQGSSGVPGASAAQPQS